MITRMEVVILVGLPGSGKTSFFRTRFAATHAHVSKDLLPNARDKGARQIALVESALRAGRGLRRAVHGARRRGCVRGGVPRLNRDGPASGRAGSRASRS